MARRRIWLGVGLLAAAALALGRLGCLGREHDGARDHTGQGSAPRAIARTEIVATGPAVIGDRDVGRDPRAGGLRLEGQILDEDDHPVGDAAVTLATRPPRTTQSDDDGSFWFDGLAASDYGLLANKASLRSDYTAVRLTETSAPVIVRVRAGATVIVHVVDAETARPIAGATVETWGHAVVSGPDGLATVRGAPPGSSTYEVRARGHGPASVDLAPGDDPEAVIEKRVELRRGAPLSGTVVAPDGTLVADAIVEVDALASAWQGTADADAQGAWHVDALAPGRYALRATSRIYGAAPDVVIELDGKPRAGVVVRLDVGGQLVGTVVSANGAPVAGARVIASGAGGFAMDEMSDAAGRFHMLGTPPGAFTVYAHHEGTASATMKVNLVAGERVAVRLVVEDASIAGTVVDSRGHPVADAIVRAWSSDLALATPLDAVTDGQGAFTLGGLPPGAYELTTAHRDERPNRHAPRTARTGDHAVRLVLSAPSSITGRVVLDGAPVPYFGVVLNDHPELGSWGDPPTAIHAVDGRFTLRRVASGTWTLVVVGPGFARKAIPGIQVDETQETDLGDVVVDRGRRVHGRVLDGSGAPIAGATVTVEEQSGYLDEDDPLRSLAENRRTTRSDAAGRYQVDGIAPPERPGDPIRIAARRADRGASPARTLPDHDVEVELVITATGGIDGTVVADHPAGLVLAARVDDYNVELQANADASGAFRFDDVPAGEYEVRLFSSPHEVGLAPVRVTVTAGHRPTVRFVKPSATVTLNVHVDGAACRYATLRPPGEAHAMPLGLEHCHGSDATLAGVPPAAYRLCADAWCVPLQVAATPSQQDVVIPARP